MADIVTPYLGLTEPDVTGDVDVWGGLLNADLELIDQHDHTVGKGLPVPTAGLDIDDDLSFQGHAAINMGGAVFTPGASPGHHAVWSKTADGDLYYTDGAGNEIRLTAGGTINMTLVGGINGDYAAAGASLYYDDANKTYRALQAAPLPNVWASISCGDLDLYEKASGISRRTRLKSHAALAASYDLTLPAALPGSTSVLTVDAAGAVATTRDVTIDKLTVVGIDGITATKVKDQQEHVVLVPASAGVSHPGAGTATTDGTLWSLATATTNAVMFPVVLTSNDRVVDVVFHLSKTTDNSHHVVMSFKRMDVSNGSLTTIATVDDSANAPGYVAVSLPSVNEILDEAYNYFLTVDGSGTGGDTIYGAAVGYKRDNV